jgi:acyltransferase
MGISQAKRRIMTDNPESSRTTDDTAEIEARPPKRDYSIDVLKGIGIVIIAMGHIDSSGVGGAFISYLYTFNVALFFVIAGYMGRDTAGQSFFGVVAKKFRQIYLPYVALFTVSLLYGHLVVRYVFGQYVIPFEWLATVKALLFASEWLNTVPTFNFALWFLPIFFLASIAFFWISKIRQPLAYSAVILGLLIISLPVQFLLPGRPVLTINVLPVALALMGCGQLLKRYRVVERLRPPVLISLVVFTLVISALAPGNISGIATYWFFPSAVASFVLYLRLAQSLSDNKFLRFVGKNSLIVFGIHGLIASTYPFTRVPNGLDNYWDGVMLYAENLAYVVLGSVLFVAAFHWMQRLFRAAFSRWRAGAPET